MSQGNRARSNLDALTLLALLAALVSVGLQLPFEQALATGPGRLALGFGCAALLLLALLSAKALRGGRGSGESLGAPGRSSKGLVSILALAVAGYAQIQPAAVRSLFSKILGPPRVELSETYAHRDGAGFDHSLFDGLLHRFVDAGGWVDYEGLSNETESLDRYLESLSQAPFPELSRDGKLALLINAYNAFTLKLILDFHPVSSIKDIPGDRLWDHQRWRLSGETYSLNQIEHQEIRPHFREPRIHFALVCAAVDCPPLRDEAYVGERLDQQLEEQARFVHRHESWVSYRPGGGEIALTPLYDWYGDDFRQVSGGVLESVARYVPALNEELNSGRKPTIRFLDYDWSLNSLGNKRPR